MSNAEHAFVYSAQPSRVVFGSGSLGRLADEVKAIGAKKALVLCTPEQRKQAQVAADLLGPLSVGIYDGAQMHVPIESARKAREHARSLGADCMVAIGGGSTIGLGKAIALESTVPIVAVPTTYAGSEMTPIYGITEDKVKKTGRDLRVLPKTVIYDPELSATLPVRMSIVSGMNAIAHAAEGLYAKDGNPVMSLMAEEGIRALATGMRGVFASSSDMPARSGLTCGAVKANTNRMKLDQDIALALRLADAAAAAIKPYFRTVMAERKGDDTPVTMADRAAEEAMRRILTAEVPRDTKIGEEFGASAGS